MKILKLFFLILYSTGNLNSQTTGFVKYKHIVVLDTVLDGIDETEGILYFDSQNQQSLYIWDKKNRDYKREFKKMEDGSIKTILPNGSSGTDVLGKRIYKNFKSSIIYARELSDKWYVITDTINLKWDISSKTKEIKGMTLQKATCDFRGRSYTAWFNPNVPIPDGPYKFKGLPGLIMEVYDEKKQVRFELISASIPSAIDETITKPTSGETIDFNTFLQKRIKNIEEAPKRFQAQALQRGIQVSGGTMRTNMIERSL